MQNHSKLQQDPSEILARLLSAERITMIKSNVATASFDLKNRTMYLPNWKDMSLDEEIMLVLHEMSHALFTTQEEYEEIFKKYKHIKGYCNVIEDVRAETLMKNRYPGSRRQFSQGYTSLFKRNFFQTDELDPSTMLAIDKLNLYFKVGSMLNVQLNDIEQGFANKISSVKTIPEVIAVALEIWEYSKQQREEQKQQQEQQKIKGDADGSESDASQQDNDQLESQEFGSDSNYGGVDSGEEESEELASGSEDSDNDLQSVTDKAFYDNLENQADVNTEIVYVDCAPAHKIAFKDKIVSYKTILADVNNKSSTELQDRHGFYHAEPAFKIKKSVTAKFRKNNTPFISYMIKEFEMKKAASAYKRAMISKTGQLDVRKLYAYKIKDELFKQTVKITTEKNHGMLFLLDWSGSMNETLHETLQQCILLASFCHRSQIPFQVLAFTDSYSSYYYRDNPDEKQQMRSASILNADNPKGLLCANFHLLEFFSNKMTTVEFNNMVDVLLSKFYKRNCFSRYSTGGTPLNEAMLYMTDYVGVFKKINGIEKMSLITLTDGEGGSLSHYDTSNKQYDPWSNRVQKKMILRDPLTNRQYAFDRDNVEQISVFNQIIKDRYDAKIVKFYLANLHYRGVSFAADCAKRFLRSVMTAKECCASGYNYTIDTIATDFGKQIGSNTFAYAVNIGNHDEIYLIDVNTKIIDFDDYMEGIQGRQESLDSEDCDDTLPEEVLTASRSFSDGMNASKKSRILLNRFINIIA